MRETILRRLLQVGIVVTVGTIMLVVTAGLSAAAPGDHGNSAKVRHNASDQVGNSGKHGNLWHGEQDDDQGEDPDGNARPGWGFGDRNHEHYGPPGQGCAAGAPCEGAAAAAVSTEPATHFSVSAPSSVSAGSSFSFTVRALDQNNNRTSAYNGTVHFTSSNGAASLPADSTLTNGIGTFSAILYTVGSQTITATDSGNTSITGTSGPITVSAAAPTHFAFSVPASATAGSSFSFTVTALDANNNTATSYSGTVRFTSSDGQASLPADTTLSGGTGSFSATLRTAGNQTITATDTSNSAITGASGSISVSPTSATHFSVSAPSSVSAGSSFSFTVTALDANNNIATSYGGTVNFSASGGSPTLPSGSTLTNGVGTFSATFASTGDWAITATDSGNSSITGTSGTITVAQPTSAVATHFAVSTPANIDAGTAFEFTVTALDANNSAVTSYSGTIHFTSTDPSAVLPGDSGLSNGTGTFTATLNRRGNRTITATDTSNPSVTGMSGRILVK